MDKNQMISLVNERQDLQKYLFIRGFLISNKEYNLRGFPFFGNWETTKFNNYFYYTHKLTDKSFYQDESGRVFFIMGHAYNPFTMQISEIEILKKISSCYQTEKYFDAVSELTGVFVLGTEKDGVMEFLVDPAGMQSACYGEVNGSFYISSHAQLVGDLEGLEMDSFVKKLTEYKWYNRICGPYLPADLTPFSLVKRIVPSISYKYDGKVSHKRFWPIKEIEIVKSQEEYNEVIEKSATIMKNNLTLISKKWNKPWISLTGGIDSNSTFASANGNYDKFETFSYLSAEKEVPDVEAAKIISKAFNVKHNVFEIPTDNQDVEDFDVKVAIQQHNSGYLAKRYDNESRKRFYLEKNCSCDVEVKSWVSETIRGYWYKYYNRKKLPKLSAKLFRNLYKIFTFNRKLAWEVDKIFKKYIKEFEYDKIPSVYPIADIHYNEVTWGSWGGLNISEMKFCFNITLPFNNRILLDTLFRIPLEDRILDKHHLEMKKYLNKELYDMNIRVVNMKETKFRANALNLIFTINSILPF